MNDLNGWHCENCNQQFPQPDYRYITSVKAADMSGMTWMTLFNEQLEQIIGENANIMQELKSDVRNRLFVHFHISRLLTAKPSS